MISRSDITPALAARLIGAQFPRWAQLPVRPVEVSGWDNRTYRLGDDMSVRLPSDASYAEQVAKEQRWLPRLAPQLPLPIPTPLAAGVPGPGYRLPWSVYRWIDGTRSRIDRIPDLTGFAVDLARFLLALQRIDVAGGPVAGPHSFYRGGPLTVYDDETRAALTAVGDSRALAVWEEALAATWHGPPVWVHGDVAEGNLLLDGHGRLGAVIDFGCCAVGDPACDLQIAWTLLSGPSRQAYRDTLGVDAGTWARGRGWALWKSLITVAAADQPVEDLAQARRTLEEVLTSRC